MSDWRDARRVWKDRKREWKDMRRAWKRGGGEGMAQRQDQGGGASPFGRLPVWGPKPGVTRRFGWRVWFLPLFLWPLFLDLPISIIRGHGPGLLGAALGIGFAFAAASRMARGLSGDAERGSRFLGLAAGFTAGFGAGFGPFLAVALGFGAYLGARLITDDLPEEEPPPPPPEPERRPEETPALAGPVAQLSRIREVAPALPEAPRLLRAADAMAGVLDDIAARPERRPAEARRFLAVHLDGLSRIVDRLEAGALPPPSLPDLLETLTNSATKLRHDLREKESEALDIQVKVLSDRLKQEGL